MTRHTDTDRRTDADARTMGDVNHANPVTGKPFGELPAFRRGQVAVGDREPADGRKPMSEVDHTPREGALGADGAYVRGGEHSAGTGSEEGDV